MLGSQIIVAVRLSVLVFYFVVLFALHEFVFVFVHGTLTLIQPRQLDEFRRLFVWIVIKMRLQNFFLRGNQVVEWQWHQLVLDKEWHDLPRRLKLYQQNLYQEAGHQQGD